MSDEDQPEPQPFDHLASLFGQLGGQSETEAHERSAALRANCREAFEVFTALQEAGFTEEQALTLMTGTQHR